MALFGAEGGKHGYLPDDPNATAIRREVAGLIQSVEKIVVSDTITSQMAIRRYTKEDS